LYAIEKIGYFATKQVGWFNGLASLSMNEDVCQGIGGVIIELKGIDN